MLNISEHTIINIYGKEFEIIKFVGQGKFGGVWQVKNPLGYKQAIKIHSIASDKYGEFLKNLAILKKLDHPHLVLPLEFGLLPLDSQKPVIKDGRWHAHTDGMGAPFVIFPYAEQNLQQYLQGEVELLANLKFALQLCLGLKKIHSYLIPNKNGKTEKFFHGNLHPRNILLFTKGKRCVLKIADLSMNSHDSRGGIHDDFLALSQILHALLAEMPNTISELLAAIESKQYQPKRLLGKLIKELWDEQRRVHKIQQAYSLYILALNLLENGADDYALKDIERALQLRPDFYEAIVCRGDIYRQTDKYEKALDDYQQAIALNPDLPLAYENRAELFAEQEKYKKAIVDFQKAIELDPESGAAYGGLGMVYSAIGEQQKAVDHFSKTISLTDDFAPAYIDRAEAFVALKQYAQALQDYQAALEIDPECDEQLPQKIEQLRTLM